MGFSLFLGPTSFYFGNIPAPKPAAPLAPAVPSYTVALTAYNAVPEQTDDTPFETASGAYSNPEIIMARSVDLASKLPFGTIVELDGSSITRGDECGYNVVERHIGYRVIEDSMNAKFTKRVDVLFDTKANYTSPNGTTRNAANVLGLCRGVTLRVVGYVDINHLPKTQVELARIVENGNVLAFNK
jgi:3D (Asp-Asp-Asp) domain-containing protein